VPARDAHDKSRREEAVVSSASTAHPNAGLSRLAAAVGDLIVPVASAAGYDVEDVEITPAGKRRVLRVVVDRDGGFSLDDVAEISRAFSVALDSADVMGAAPYVLEVTSPGVDRPLVEPRHWRRAVGRLVRVRKHGGGDIRGRIVAADDTTVTIASDGGEQRVAYADLGRGRIELEFDRTERAAEDAQS
jgi:ribosome maturation factor RimP